MTNVELAHNPYRLETTIKIDGVEISAGPLKEKTRNRLQVWIEEILPALADHCNSRTLDVTFHGTEPDYDDLQGAAADARSQGFQIRLTHRPAVPPDQKTSDLNKLFEEARGGPFDEFRGVDLERNFRKALDPGFEVSVIATMSSGKSTLINAMLGCELLPAKNEACTATVTRITDHDGLDGFTGRAFGAEGRLFKDWLPVTPEILQEWNCVDITEVEIHGDVPTIRSKNAQLVLVDTPGPNNSRNESHRATTVGVIKDRQMPMVLYVLNATQLSTNDDQTLLAMVAEAMKVGGKQARDRFIFAVNKMDGLDPDKESIPGLVENARSYLKENGVERPNVYPLSSLAAKLIRLHRRGAKLTRAQGGLHSQVTALFSESPEMAMLQYAPVSPSVRRKVGAEVEKARASGDPELLALWNSGLPTVETAIEEYLEKYAIPAKIADAVSTFRHILDKNDALRKIEEDLQASEGQRQELHGRMSQVRERMGRGEEAKRFRNEVKCLDWKLTPAYAQRIASVEGGFEKHLYEIGKDLETGDVSPREANALLRTAENHAGLRGAEVIAELESSVRDETLRAMESLRSGYQRYVQDLLGEAKNLPEGLVQGFTAAAASLPPASNLLAKYTHTVTVKIGKKKVKDSSWYKPWTWGDHHWEDITEAQERVDMSKVGRDVVVKLRADFHRSLKEAETDVQARVEKLREGFLAEMTVLDEKVRGLVDEMHQMSASEKALKDQIVQNQEKMEWLRCFEERLNTVLAI